MTLAGDGEVVPVKFDLPPLELGPHMLCMRIKSSSAAGSGPLFAEDKVVVDAHKMRVLLLAGGPMRDYQFLRTMLFRDKSIVVDVLLQSGQPGISQEAANLLSDFPTSKAQMAEYDCLVAFDPDWQLLTPEQVDLLYDWVDQDHGGMIVAAGAVNAARPDGWVQNGELAKIGKLYPVEFNSGLSSKSNVMYGSDEAARLEFSPEGEQAPYLWLGDSAVASQVTWSQFGGVFGFCPVRDKKAGATVLARFGDSRTAVDGKLPIYMAVHRFSASPVIYLGSAETWRLRRLNPAWFEMLWTKMVRYAAQEHLRRQSARGSLVIDNNRFLVGSTVEVRAELKNSELRPLVAPGVSLIVTRDGKDQQTMTMPADPAWPGRFLLDLPVLQQGDYSLKLLVPQSLETLTRTFHGVVPKLEDENPQRNAALLQEIAKKTDGAYYPDLAVALSDTATPSLADLLKDVSHTDKIPLAPKPEDDEKLLKWMLIALLRRTVPGVDSAAAGEIGVMGDAWWDSLRSAHPTRNMATLEHEPSQSLPPAVRSRIDALRAGIRRYVWLEGLAAAAIWLGLWFWASMAIDWTFEPPRAGPRGPPRGGRSRPGSGDFPLYSPPDLCPSQR